jgi:hypothetical protein
MASGPQESYNRAQRSVLARGPIAEAVEALAVKNKLELAICSQVLQFKRLMRSRYIRHDEAERGAR